MHSSCIEEYFDAFMLGWMMIKKHLMIERTTTSDNKQSSVSFSYKCLTYARLEITEQLQPAETGDYSYKLTC